MKRSEMLKKMVIAFQMEKNVKNSSDIDALSVVLQVIEDEGMAPPDNNHYNAEYGEWRHWEDESK